MVTKEVTQWIFNPNSSKSYCLNFTGIYFHSIFTRPFPQVVQILLQLSYVVFICDFPINDTVVSEQSNTRIDVPPNIIYVHKEQY
jgi:hypothetical protein